MLCVVLQTRKMKSLKTRSGPKRAAEAGGNADGTDNRRSKKLRASADDADGE